PAHPIHFDISFTHQTKPLDCNASLATDDGKGFIARLASFPTFADDDPRAENFLTRQTAVCMAAQRAYLKGAGVSVTGLVESAGNAGTKQLGTFTVQAYSTLLPAGEATFGTSSGALSPANVCNALGCNVNGTVAMVSYPMADGPLCTARMMVPQSDGSNHPATVQVTSISKDLLQTEPSQRMLQLKLLNARFQACQMLEEAFNANHTATVLGYQNSDGSVEAFDVMMENSPAANLDPLF